jgi:thioredoxin 1
LTLFTLIHIVRNKRVFMGWLVSFFIFFCGFSFAEENAAVSQIADNNDIVQITRDNFEDTVAQSTLPTIVDVNAAWCNPCRMMEPIIDELSEEYNGTIQFGKIDFDSQSELIKKFSVSSLPTILFFKKGQKIPVMKHAGFLSKEEFKVKITTFLKK